MTEKMTNHKTSFCSDIDECRQTPSPCSNGLCENTPGSFRCTCRTGYRQQGGTCIGTVFNYIYIFFFCASHLCVCLYTWIFCDISDVNECEDPAQCPGQECVNSQGSYRCVSCRPGFNLRNGACAGIQY